MVYEQVQNTTLYLHKAKKKMFGCTPSTGPNVQGWPPFFLNQNIQIFSKKLYFSKISKH